MSNGKEDQVLDQQLKTYRPVEGPSWRQLEWGLWWVEHRAFLYRLLVMFFVGVNVILWSYSLYYLVGYAYSGIIADQRLARLSAQAQLFNPASLRASGARSLSLGPVQVFAGPNAAYDLASLVANPNPNWYARFDYFFVVGQDATPVQRAFILPQESKYLTYFLYQGPRPGNARMQVSNIVWQRVDTRSTGDIARYIKEHLDIGVRDVTVSEVGGGMPLNRVSFTAVNNSPYNYAGVDLHLTLTAGARTLGVNQYRLESLYSGETREVMMLWAGSFGGGNINIQPSVDIFASDNYLRFDLGPGQVK